MNELAVAGIFPRNRSLSTYAGVMDTSYAVLDFQARPTFHYGYRYRPQLDKCLNPSYNNKK
jgi:hypothetical protein